MAAISAFLFLTAFGAPSPDSSRDAMPRRCQGSGTW